MIVILFTSFQHLMSKGLLNDAFETALSANDLALVMYTCELVNTTQIFSTADCPLNQSVLLSLITQLSVDLQVNGTVEGMGSGGSVTKLTYDF